jgi:hypothetical protein
MSIAINVNLINTFIEEDPLTPEGTREDSGEISYAS